MISNIIPIKAFLGKYYQELAYSAAQEKYNDIKLSEFFDQRFFIQNNKVEMIIDPGLTGLGVTISGNEIHISKELYDHHNVIVTNSFEGNQIINPRSLYNPENFSTLAYLVCQNRTTFQIIGQIDEPIYVRYKSDYETFYNSVVVFNISNEVDVEIVEEIESLGALNVVTDYILYPYSRLNLTTFYQNHFTALSMNLRNIVVQDNAKFNHILLGKGSYKIIDENRIRIMDNSSAELLGIINSNGWNFHSILYVEPVSPNYQVSVNYKDILLGKSNISFFPVLASNALNNSASIEVSNVRIEEIPPDRVEQEIKDYISDIINRATLERMVGVGRFYANKSKFQHFL
jgi:hypothetical protein